MNKCNLKFSASLNFFTENLRGTNHLSDTLLSDLELGNGIFYTFLPNLLERSSLYDFYIGGKSLNLKELISDFIIKKIKDYEVNCIFDDVNTSIVDVDSDELFRSNGLSYCDEVYYFVSKQDATFPLILKCLQYSDANWHSLCIITKYKIGKPVTSKELQLACKEALWVILGSYDAEAYVIWEKNHNI